MLFLLILGKFLCLGVTSVSFISNLSNFEKEKKERKIQKKCLKKEKSEEKKEKNDLKENKNNILLVLPFEEISLLPELSSPTRFRIQGGWSERDGRSRTVEEED